MELLDLAPPVAASADLWRRCHVTAPVSSSGRTTHCRGAVADSQPREWQTGPVERAQDTFRRMMQTEVAPALRNLGFKGSGHSFMWPSDTHWAQLGFQKSTRSDARKVVFTVNVSVVEKGAWDEERARHPDLGGERPAPNTTYGPPAWTERIGFLLPTRKDLWWSVKAGASTTRSAGEVVAAIREYALPEIARQIEGSPEARKRGR